MVVPVPPQKASRTDLVGPDADTMIGVLAEENPGSARSEIETAGRAAAALTRLALNLSNEQRRRLVGNARFQVRAMEALTSVLETGDGAQGAPSAYLSGDGLGRLLSHEEGARRIQVAAAAMRIEQWAGPVAGSTALHRDLGIARSTLQVWRRQNAVIGLLKGVKREVFPLRQFIDGRPVKGISSIVEVIPEPRVAWLWLITTHPELEDRSPLDYLLNGRLSDVVALAKADYGQS